MTDGNTWKAIREVNKRRRQEDAAVNIDRFENDFEGARRLAFEHGLMLVRHSDNHYALTFRNTWRINLYPSNGRIYADKNHRAPFLELPLNWRLNDVVTAAIKKIEEEMRKNWSSTEFQPDNLSDDVKRKIDLIKDRSNLSPRGNFWLKVFGVVFLWNHPEKGRIEIYPLVALLRSRHDEYPNGSLKIINGILPEEFKWMDGLVIDRREIEEIRAEEIHAEKESQ